MICQTDQISENKRLPGWFYVLLALFSGFCLFYHLDDRLLWADEAETALLGVNILKYGVPKVDDGKNLITFLGDTRESNEAGIWTWTPWLDKYLAAGSFAVLGRTTLAARLPFAVIGFASVLLLAWVAQQIYRNPRVTVFASLLYVTNVAFLLHARQCRYYAVTLLAQVVLIYGWVLLRRQSRAGIAAFAGGLVLMFYSNYILVIAPVIVAAALAVLVYRRERRFLADMGLSLGLFALLATPWMLYAHPWTQVTGAHKTAPAILDMVWKTGFYLLRIHYYVLPLFLLAIPLAFKLCRKRPASMLEDRSIGDLHLFLWICLPVHLVLLNSPPGQFFRYLLPCVPTLMLLFAFILVYYARPRILQFALLALVVLTNSLSAASGCVFGIRTSYQMPIITFIRDITTHYDNAAENVVAFFKEKANPNQSLMIADPEFPIIFYTDMRIMDVLHYPYQPESDPQPDWILSRSISGPKYFNMNVNPKVLANYDPIQLEVPASPPGDCWPDPDNHVSFTIPTRQWITIYHKKPSPPVLQ